MILTAVAEPPTERATPLVAERTFRRAAWLIISVSTLVFVWFLTTGRGDLLDRDIFGGFFEVQARAMLDGNLSIPTGSLGFEGFVVDGRTYTYFGVFPSLLRMPVMLVTDELDGRMTIISMLVAYLIAMTSSVRIIDRTHRLLRGDRGWTRSGVVLAGITVAVLGLGSNLMYASSRAWVYHEAALWGTAGALASFAAVLAFLERPRTRPIVVAGIWAAIAWLSRGSVGLGPTVVLGLLGLAHLTGFRFVQTLAPRPVDPDTSDGRGRWSRQPKRAAWLLAASLTGAAAFGVINTAKFGSPNGLPIDKQVSSIEAPWPERKAAFAAYGGNLFSAELVPANVVQGLRPDLLAPTSVWPLVRYRYAEPIGVFTPVFDTVEPSAGLTLTVPALLVLGTVGAVAAFRPRRWTGRDRRPPGNETSLRPFLIGAAGAAAVPLTIAFISQRYLLDAVPLLVVAAGGGLAVLDRWTAAADPRPSHRNRVVATVAAVAVLAVCGTYVNLSVTWLFQRITTPKDTAARAAGLRTQALAHERFGLGAPPVDRAASPPATVRRGHALIVGDCKALYWGTDRGVWDPIETTEAVGHHHLRVDLTGPPTGDPVPLLTVRGDGHDLVLAVDRSTEPGSGSNDVQVISVRDGKVATRGPAVDAEVLDDADVFVSLDQNAPGVHVTKGDRGTGTERGLLFDQVGAPAVGPVVVGANAAGGPVAARFPDPIRAVPIPTPACDALDAIDR